LEDDLPHIICAGEIIERVNEFKYLGVYFDSHFTFQRHYEHVLAKISSSVGCLLKIKRYLNLHLFKVLVNSFIYSHIDYCFPVWGNLSDTHIQTLQNKINSLLGAYFYPHICNKFQKYNKIAHFYDNTPYKQITLNYPDLWERCNLLSVTERLKYFHCMTAFSAIRFPARVPEISELFKMGNSARSQNLILMEHEAEIYKKSAFYQAVLIWNSLNPDAKQSDNSLGKFRKIVDNWLIMGRESEFVHD